LRVQVDRVLNTWEWRGALETEGTAVDALEAAVGGYILNDGGYLVYNEETGVWERDPITPNALARAVVNSWIVAVGRGGTPFIRKLDSFRGQTGILLGLGTRPGIACKSGDFDAAPDWINCAGLAVNLRTGATRGSRPDDRFTKSAMCRPKAGPTPFFDKFLSDFACGDAELVRYILWFLGGALTGLMLQRVFLYLHGGGGNGKSKFLEISRAIWGGYYATANPSLFSLRGDASKNSQYYSGLVGARLAANPDVPDGSLNLDAVKTITGDDPVTVKRLYRDEFQASLTCKLIMASNKRLKLREFTEAVKTRIRLVPCNQILTAGTRDPRIVEKVLTEAPAILAKLIDEAVKYCNDDREPACAAITRETNRYLDGQDTLGEFLSNQFEDAGRIPRSDLYAAYRQWCGENGYKVLGAARFYGLCEEKGYTQKRTEKGRFIDRPPTGMTEMTDISVFDQTSLNVRVQGKFTGISEKLSFLSFSPLPEAGTAPETPHFTEVNGVKMATFSDPGDADGNDFPDDFF
jgi:putative DNA primase/helicase